MSDRPTCVYIWEIQNLMIFFLVKNEKLVIFQIFIFSKTYMIFRLSGPKLPLPLKYLGHLKKIFFVGQYYFKNSYLKKV